MRYFPLLDLQYVVLFVFLGIVAFILLYVAFSSYRSRGGKREASEEMEEYPEGIQVQNNPIPPILVFIYVGFALWAIVYLVLIGLMQGPF